MATKLLSAIMVHCMPVGNARKSILYHVDRIRDGRTYTGRAIKATQDGVPIFSMQASFKTEEQDPYQHQFTMPDVPGPEGLMNTDQLLKLALG
jgi:acyl-CoA thioesterase-2